MTFFALLTRLLYGGLSNLAAYLAAHVLLCLLPAFFIAGAMTALIPKAAVTRYLGRSTPRFISYPAAALAGSLLAVCSCTIVPLFAGIYKKGAGIGPAITFLFFAPAANILALIYTGGVIGLDLAFARLALSLTFGIGIGLIMALIFHRSDVEHDQLTDDVFAARARMGRPALFFLLLLVAMLLIGTLKIDLLTDAYATVSFPILGLDRFQGFLFNLVPYDAARGEEGVTAQGALLITLLVLLGFASWKGLNDIHAGFNRWTWAALSLAAFTLLIAALGMSPRSDGLQILITGRTIGTLLALITAGGMLGFTLSRDEVRDFLWESWKFMKQIFPLLVIGVFAVGVIRVFIQPQWIERLAGTNTLLGNLAGVLFGVFMYFPTLVEVPIARMFLDLGMHRGPLLAYLMADPELSLQSILIVSTIIGRLKSWTYVGWVALFSTLAGLIYGAWVDGLSVALVSLYLLLFITFLGLVLSWVSRRNLMSVLPQKV